MKQIAEEKLAILKKQVAKHRRIRRELKETKWISVTQSALLGDKTAQRKLRKAVSLEFDLPSSATILIIKSAKEGSAWSKSFMKHCAKYQMSTSHNCDTELFTCCNLGQKWAINYWQKQMRSGDITFGRDVFDMLVDFSLNKKIWAQNALINESDENVLLKKRY